MCAYFILSDALKMNGSAPRLTLRKLVSAVI